jgi:hypothetical protein
MAVTVVVVLSAVPEITLNSRFLVVIEPQVLELERDVLSVTTVVDNCLFVAVTVVVVEEEVIERAAEEEEVAVVVVVDVSVADAVGGDGEDVVVVVIGE